MFWKRSLFPEFLWKKDKISMQVRITNKFAMMHTIIIEELPIEIGGVQYVILILLAINPLNYDMIIGNNFQRLYSPCTQTINQIIFIINGHSFRI